MPDKSKELQLMSSDLLPPVAVHTRNQRRLWVLLGGIGYDFRKNKTLLLMALPGVLLLLVFAYLPMIGTVIAFLDYRPTKGIFGSKWVGFENFRFLFGTGDAWKLTFRTLAYNATFISFDQVFSLVVALVLNEVRSRWFSRVYQSILFIPFLLSWVVVGYLSFALFKTDGGAFNSLLKNVGMQRVRWYSSPQYWPPILVLISFWKNIGLGTTIYLAGMMAINPEFYEAAKVDGANKLQQIRYVTLPLLTGLVIIIVLLGMGRILRAEFGLFYNVTRDYSLLYRTTDVLDTYVFRALRSQGNVAMASAAGLYQSAVSFVLVLVANWTIRRIDPDRALF